MQYRPASARDPAGSVERSLRAVGRRFGRPTCPLDRAAPGDGLPRVPPLASRGDAPNTTRLAVPSQGPPGEYRQDPQLWKCAHHDARAPLAAGPPGEAAGSGPASTKTTTTKGGTRRPISRGYIGLELPFSSMDPRGLGCRYSADIRCSGFASASSTEATSSESCCWMT